MATYTITATPSGSSKDNAAQRNIAAVFPYDASQYKTISELVRKDGIWCSCGGASQSVALAGYDQLIDNSTGAVIKTSSAGSCKCHGTGPATENYMTCTFSDWTQAESNAAVAAWAAGTLIIKRTVSITAYTSSNHGTPIFRDGYYNDTITITGSTAPFTDYKPEIVSFSCMRSGDGLTEEQLSTSVYARIQLKMNNTAGLDDNPRLILRYSTRTDFSSYTEISLGSTSAAITPYLSLALVKLGDSFSVGSSYYFQLIFSAGEEVAQYSGVSVGMSYTPIHIPQSNAGVALGMYSNASGTDRRFECNYPAYLYGGIAQIGDGWTALTPTTGTTPADYGGGALRCRAIGDKRIVDGSLSVKPGSEAIVLATLPGGYTPTKSVFAINACSGSRVARIAVGGAGEANAGKLCLNWVKNLSDGASYTSAAIWVQCSIEYWID